MNKNLKIENQLSHLESRILNETRTDHHLVICGKIVNSNGLTIEVEGLSLAVGETCQIHLDKDNKIDAEVIAFKKNAIVIMAYEQNIGIAKGMLVTPLNKSGIAPVCHQLLGRVVDAIGRPIDGKGMIKYSDHVLLYPPPINPLKRERIRSQLDVGVRAINSLISICKGQRMGIFAESGIGKSVLLGMMTKFTEADIVVVGLIGERGREVKEFIEEILGENGLHKSIIVASSADQLPIMKVLGATYATCIAEFFRDQGKNVLLIIDSLTRYAQSYRELALSSGELPTAKGYPPSVFSKLSNLVERSGNGTQEKGSITALYTLLLESENISDPIAEHARSLIDGHIVLSKELAESGHYPAIDIEKSMSRLMHLVVDKKQQIMANLFKQIVSNYQKNKDIINIGMYQAGSDPLIDYAIQYRDEIRLFLTQDKDTSSSINSDLKELSELLSKIEGAS